MFLLTYLGKRNCSKLSEVSQFCVKSHKGFGEKDEKCEKCM